MSSACTCHIDGELCWYCLYEFQRQKNIKYEKALREISEMPKIRGIGTFETKYNTIIDTALMTLRDK